MKRYLLCVIISVIFAKCCFCEDWIETGLWFGSNNFLRNDATFLTKISTRMVAGINASYHKLERENKVYSLRLPVNFLISKNVNLSLKPFYYPENGNNISAYGGRISFLYHTQNDIKEIYTDWNFSFGWEKEKFPEDEILNKAVEFQIEQNFYDEFFIVLNLSTLINPENSVFAIKRYSEISDIISSNVFAFINDVVDNNLGIRFARSFKPEYDSYLYIGADRLNCRYVDYNSYLLGLRVYFFDKNFFDFSYNYLDKKSGKDKNYYKINIGVFF